MTPRRSPWKKPKVPEARVMHHACDRIPSTCDPLSLLDEACLILDSAQGMARLLCDLLPQAEDANQDDLAQAMWGVATLIEMGQCSAQEAHRHLLAVREKV